MYRLKDLWGSIITAGSGLVGVVLGAVLVGRIQAKAQRVEREERHAREKEEARFKLYNQILKVDGEIEVVSDPTSLAATFSIDEYRDKIRPLLFEGLHLLDPEVRVLAKRMDVLIGRYIHDEVEDEIELNRDMITMYWELIRTIKNKYEQQEW